MRLWIFSRGVPPKLAVVFCDSFTPLLSLPVHSVEAWLHIDALALPSSSAVSTNSFTLPAFGPRLVALLADVDAADDAVEERAALARRQTHGQAELIECNDGTGAHAGNSAQWRDAAVLFQRGGIAFAEKVRRAQAAGARPQRR